MLVKLFGAWVEPVQVCGFVATASGQVCFVTAGGEVPSDAGWVDVDKVAEAVNAARREQLTADRGQVTAEQLAEQPQRASYKTEPGFALHVPVVQPPLPVSDPHAQDRLARELSVKREDRPAPGGEPPYEFKPAPSEQGSGEGTGPQTSQVGVYREEPDGLSGPHSRSGEWDSKHPVCGKCGWRKGGPDSWDGKSCKCGETEPPLERVP